MLYYLIFNTSIISIIDEYSNYIYTVFIVLLSILLILNILTRNKLKEFKKKNDFVKSVINLIDNEKSLEENLMNVLYAVSTIVTAPSYAFFVLDDKNNKYVLKAIRNVSEGSPQIAPSYSGLLPYKKETFLIPPNLPIDIKEDRTTLIKEGEVPLLVVPLQKSKSLILIGPIRKVDRKSIKLLDLLNEKTYPLLNSLFQIHDLNEKLNVSISSGKAVKNMSNVFTDYKGMLDMILNLTIKSISASGGMLIKSSNNGIEFEGIIGLEKDTIEFLYEDKKVYHILNEIIAENNDVFINKKNNEFYKLPPYFIAEDIHGILITKIATGGYKGLAVFWYKDHYEVKAYQMTALKIMVKRLGDIINSYLRFKQLSSSYIDILKSLAKLVDNLSVNTIGYSELMFRYSVIIAKELGLSKDEIGNIALAAYLSNIGIIGLSEDLFNKKGKYTEMEYEMMKLHSEVGASIIEATIANDEVSSIIRHHHERIDGFGYPEGLKGEEIPIGARILAVIQTFLAKIQAREYRSALPFDQALKQLRASANTQLDEEVVEALIGWFERKQEEKKDSPFSLGRCWEMRCSPENICLSCPAYKDYETNCWEKKTNNCSAHGNYCENCFVRTEYLSRRYRIGEAS